jgi:hypothetical protein
MIAPLINKATIWTASPTDLSCVVIVVLKPISRMIIVEKEFTTPLGIALENDRSVLSCTQVKSNNLTLRIR